MSMQKKQRLLLHVCCAPCSSHVLEYLYATYNVTAFFYNPNITDREEYNKRINELRRFVTEAPFAKDVIVCEGDYEPERFWEMSAGLEEEPERGKRCYKCYELRMKKAAEYALENGYDIFTTTLSISPHKNAAWINEIGNKLSELMDINYLYSDFKKQNGYLRSIELSREYGLYRQNYCGCIFSKKQAEERKKNL
ncbi:MAG: epoxyqueuosine reductase QueH [Lachnospiraceae bacterium]|nr:epoxyqueuosine reductase QueH [Lachnospiraceae bacterium]